MSLTKKARKLRSGIGKDFPDQPPSHGDERFAAAIAAALRRDFGDDSTAVKAVAKLVDVNDRAAKNWFTAKNAPNGELLVRLIAHSDEVLETILALARRDQLLRTKRIDDTRRTLRELLVQLDSLFS